MNNSTLIPLYDFCMKLGVETSFLLSLEEYGLLHTVTIEHTVFIDAEELLHLEKMVRLHKDLDINIAGLEAISHLLGRMGQMEEEIVRLTNRLRLYE